MNANRQTPSAIVIHPKDNVGTATRVIRRDSRVLLDSGDTVVARQAIPVGHKIAIADIRKGGRVTKYGEAIGVTVRAIRVGDHAHVKNVVSRRGRKA